MTRRSHSGDDTPDILSWAARHAGLSFPPSRTAEMRQTVKRAMKAAGAASPAAYLHALQEDQATRDALITAVTVGETFFFRDPSQLEMIRSRILPELMSRRPGGVRAWSAGCATGEEAYTLAILLLEAGALGNEKVLGTDLSAQRLRRARAARYRRWALRGLDHDETARYFRRSAGWYELDRAVRERVRFRRLNLLQEDAEWPAGMDLIVCRNVLIYLDRASIARVVERLVDALAPDGWLLLGAADPPLAETDRCETIVTEAGLAYRCGRHRQGERARQMPVVDERAAPPAKIDIEPRVPESPGPPRTPTEPTAIDSQWPRPGEETGAAAPVPRHVAPEAAAGAGDEIAVPDELDAAMTYVWDLADRGLLRGAAAACDTALARWGPRADLLGLKAFVLVAARDATAAADAARRALYLEPQRIVAHVALGEALSQMGAVLPASRAFRNAERLLAELPADEPVAGTRNDSVASLAALARLRLQQLGGRRR